jgi:hypothetical protein
VERVGALRTRVLDAALRRLARRVAEDVLRAAQARRDDGRLEFHDLLVLARDLLRSPEYGAAVRAALQQRYRRPLLDEFQDTDPIQIELAARIAGGADADAADWADVAMRGACSWSATRSSPSTGSAAPTSPPTCRPSRGSATVSSCRPTSARPPRCCPGSTTCSAGSSRPSRGRSRRTVRWPNTGPPHRAAAGGGARRRPARRRADRGRGTYPGGGRGGRRGADRAVRAVAGRRGAPVAGRPYRAAVAGRAAGRHRDPGAGPHLAAAPGGRPGRRGRPVPGGGQLAGVSHPGGAGSADGRPRGR